MSGINSKPTATEPALELQNEAAARLLSDEILSLSDENLTPEAIERHAGQSCPAGAWDGFLLY